MADINRLISEANALQMDAERVDELKEQCKSLKTQLAHAKFDEDPEVRQQVRIALRNIKKIEDAMNKPANVASKTSGNKNVDRHWAAAQADFYRSSIKKSVTTSSQYRKSWTPSAYSESKFTTAQRSTFTRSSSAEQSNLPPLPTTDIPSISAKFEHKREEYMQNIVGNDESEIDYVAVDQTHFDTDGLNFNSLKLVGESSVQESLQVSVEYDEGTTKFQSAGFYDYEDDSN